MQTSVKTRPLNRKEYIIQNQAHYIFLSHECGKFTAYIYNAVLICIFSEIERSLKRKMIRIPLISSVLDVNCKIIWKPDLHILSKISDFFKIDETISPWNNQFSNIWASRNLICIILSGFVRRWYTKSNIFIQNIASSVNFHRHANRKSTSLSHIEINYFNSTYNL